MLPKSLRQQKDKLIAKILLRYPALFRMWEKKSDTLSFEDAPWADLKKPVSESKVALITTGGVHLRTQQPFNMDDPNGDAGFREIPADTSAQDLRITHNYYDHDHADKDINVVLPIERLQFLEKTGEIGKAARVHYSFMGHILNDQLQILQKQSIPELIKRLSEEQIDVTILSPA